MFDYVRTYRHRPFPGFHTLSLIFLLTCTGLPLKHVNLAFHGCVAQPLARKEAGRLNGLFIYRHCSSLRVRLVLEIRTLP
jgi:hypothetical protein